VVQLPCKRRLRERSGARQLKHVADFSPWMTAAPPDAASRARALSHPAARGSQGLQPGADGATRRQHARHAADISLPPSKRGAAPAPPQQQQQQALASARPGGASSGAGRARPHAAAAHAAPQAGGPAAPQHAPAASEQLGEHRGWLDYRSSRPHAAAGVLSHDDLDQDAYLCACIAGTSTWQELQRFVREHEEQLSQQQAQLAVQQLLALMPSRLDAPRQQRDQLSGFALKLL
jgi:hypothetical protein